MFKTKEELMEALEQIYSKDTAFEGKWNENIKCTNHCKIASLIYQDYFGGELRWKKDRDVTHFFICDENNNIIDLTASQFDWEFDYSNNRKAPLNPHGNNVRANRKYILFKSRLEEYCKNRKK